MANSDNHTMTRILNAWAALLVAIRKTEEGIEYGHSAEVINSPSEEEAQQIGLEMAREKFSDEGWEGHSVALLRLELTTPLKVETIGVRVGRVNVIVR